MRIKFLGHAAVEVLADSGVKILFDPYFVGCEYLITGGTISHEQITEPYDIIAISHEHPDHNTIASIPGNPEIVHGMEIRGKGKTNVKGIDFWSIGCYHDHKQGTLLGENSIICCEVDGVKIGHSGDIGHIPTEEQLDEIKKYGMDVFLLCIGLLQKQGERYEEFVIDAEAKMMNGIWEVMKPIVHCLIPIHYRSAKCDFRFITVDEFCDEKTNVTRVGGSIVEYTPVTLPSIPQIMVLEPEL